MTPNPDAGFLGLFVLMGLFGLATAVFFVWAVRAGLVRDDESPKYRMLDDEGSVPAAPPDAPEGGPHG